jgi:hypothetical protein
MSPSTPPFGLKLWADTLHRSVSLLFTRTLLE